MNARNRPGRVRIIGGQWRSRLLDVADVPGLRPSGSRVRETLFNWLTPHLPGARVLDAFAGTGALGFEALSRGASQALLVERDAAAAAALQRNAKALDAHCEVRQADARALLGAPNPGRPFDIVFLDPPFAAGDALRLCTLSADNGWLAPGGRLYLEHPAAVTVEPGPPLEPIREKTAGQVRFALYALAEGAQQ